MKKYTGYTWAKVVVMILLVIGLIMTFSGGMLLMLKGKGAEDDLDENAYMICGNTYAAKLLSQRGGVSADPSMLTKVTNNMEYGVILEDASAENGTDVENMDFSNESLYLYKSPGFTGDYLSYYVGYEGYEYYYNDRSFLEAFLSGERISDMRSSNSQDRFEIVVYQVKDQLVSSPNGGEDLFLQAAEFTSLMRTGFSLSLPLMAAGMLISVLSFLWLLKSAGHRRDSEEIHVRMADRIPLEIYAFAVLLGEGIGVSILVQSLLHELGYGRNLTYIAIIGSLAAAVFAGMVILGMLFSMSIAVRVKTKNVCRYTLCRYLVDLIRKLISAIRNHTSIMVRALVLAGVVTLLQIFVICITDYDLGAEIILFIIYKCAEISVFIWAVLQFARIMQGTREIAGGHPEKTIDTHRMYWDFKKHAEDINHIGTGISSAVEARMKSERMKTELITNVSHDIKTPLTSIINYVDLLQKEELDNEKAREYVDVLSRQSARLKKLIGDLLDASKASTGNIDLNMEPCDLNVILTQAMGEFEESMVSAHLQPVIDQPEGSVYAMADGRQLWRVFENLLGNVCKYAMQGTRVYISLKKDLEKAEISIKNISQQALNISGDELTERFVRGDSSRNTEGSGLGLSIARSLTQLMGGQMAIEIDGDLFKAILTFPLIRS